MLASAWLAQIHQWDWGKKWLDFGDLYLIFKVTPALWNSNFDRKKLVCTLYLEPRGKKMIRFWWPWLWKWRSLHYKDSKSEPCVHSISWINRWNLTRLAQIHQWDWEKKWLDFGDLDIIFKATPALWNSNFNRKKACVHIISWTNGWNFTRLAQIHHLDAGKK